ncbi:MAG: Gfo/Idh/MocA family oxidoreductase [Candidatus Latescibacteria bacterium]|nr:Gfo/Idh/MocA family oxidoreductase [Candidatus Latescibacterota bacterium]
MKKERIGFGIVGCGMIAPVHADVLEEVENGDLVAVCDKVEERAKTFAEKYGCPYYTDLNEMLARDDLHVVSVCAPPGFHKEIVEACADAGKHAIVEKPMETTLERADAMIEACDRAGVKLGVIFQNRFKKAVIHLKRAVENGALGRLILGDVYVKWFRPQSYYDISPWRGTWAVEGGGAMINQAIHTIDLLQWIMGPVESLYANMATYHQIEAEDLAVANLKFKNGALGVIEGSTALHPGVPERLEIHGRRGTVILEAGTTKMWEIFEGGPEDKPDISEETFGTGASDPMAFPILWHKTQLQDMVNAILEDRPPAVDGREGRKALEIVQAIYQSAKTGEIVRFPLK